MISVVIPLYNKENQIAATLQSVLQQTFQDFEVVVVNDGSTDGSVAAAEAVQDSRIRIIHQENAGVSAARNRGITEAKYELIAFLDADDRWKPEYLQTQYELTQKYPECSVFACNYEFVHADGSIRPTIIRKLPFEGQDGILSNYFEVASCSHPPICSISIMVRKSALLAIGGFPVGITNGEDLLTWAALACQFKIAYSSKVIACYNLGDKHGANSIPVNIPPGDAVGRKMRLMSTEFPMPYFREYISRWYRIRANLFLRAGGNVDASRNIFLSLRYNPWNWHMYVYAAILVVPTRFRNFIFKLFSR